jgi:hypothetical protein
MDISSRGHEKVSGVYIPPRPTVKLILSLSRCLRAVWRVRSLFGTGV